MGEPYGFWNPPEGPDAYPGDAVIDAANEAVDLRASIDRILGVLDEFRAWMRAEATEGDGARRWGVQHVLDHYDEPFSDAIREALSASFRRPVTAGDVSRSGRTGS